MTFQGDKKEGTCLLAKYENQLKNFLLPHVPQSIETYHLTLMTVLWSILVLIFSFLARYNIQWMWATSSVIVLQYITDLLDGAIGRERDTGLVKWGYYMDHFLDYIFLCSILIGYSCLFPQHCMPLLFYVLMFFGAFMVNSFLAFAATNKFRISYLGIGPTEIRLVFILINTLLAIFGRTHMRALLPFILGGSILGLFITVWQTQKMLWDTDMECRPEETRLTHRVHGKKTTYSLYICVALALLSLGYVGWVLSPTEKNLLLNLSEVELTDEISEDLQQIKQIQQQLEDAFSLIATSKDAELIEQHCADVIKAFGRLETLEEKYQGYNQISYVDRPVAHANAFFAGYQATVLRYQSLLQLQKMLRTPPSALQKSERVDLQKYMLVKLMDPDLHLRLNSGKMYFELIRADINENFVEKPR